MPQLHLVRTSHCMKYHLFFCYDFSQAFFFVILFVIIYNSVRYYLSMENETPAEKRIRLRRMKILADSEKRLNRIISGNSETVATSDCDNELNAKISLSENLSQTDQSFNQFGPNKRPQTSTILPPRESESFPRKVSLISSPIHYKTLQLSQQYNSMLNHHNIINHLLCNSSAKFMFILVLLAFIGSYFNVNIPMLFISYLSIKHAYNGFYRNVWRDINLNVLKELITFVFSYIIVQVTIKVASN